MIKFLRKLFSRRPVVKLHIIERERSRLTAAEFKSQKDLVARARNVLDNADVKMLMDICRNESPANMVYSEQVPSEWRATVHARIEGYHMALNTIESLGLWEEPKKEVGDPTFDAPEMPPEFLDKPNKK